LVVAVIVGSILGMVAMLYFTDSALPSYRILSHNRVLHLESVNPEVKYNYTVYAEIEKVRGDSEPVTVYCELTTEDLAKVTKQQTIYL